MKVPKYTEHSDFERTKKTAQKLRALLESKTIVVEHDGVKIITTGDQHLTSIIVDNQSIDPRILRALNEAIARTRKVAAQALLS